MYRLVKCIVFFSSSVNQANNTDNILIIWINNGLWYLFLFLTWFCISNTECQKEKQNVMEKYILAVEVFKDLETVWTSFIQNCRFCVSYCYQLWNKNCHFINSKDIVWLDIGFFFTTISIVRWIITWVTFDIFLELVVYLL